MIKAWKNIKQLWKVNGLALLEFEFIFQLTTVFVLVPLFQIASSLLLRLSGFSYFTIENVMLLLKNPFAILFLTLLFLLFLFLKTMEIITVITGFYFSNRNEKVTMPQLVVMGYDSMLELCRKKQFHLFFYSFVLLLFLIIPATAAIVTHMRMPAYFYNSFMKLPYISWLKGIFIAIWITLLLFYVYFLYFYIWRGYSPNNCRKVCLLLALKKGFSILLRLILQTLILCILSYLLYFMLNCIAAAAIMLLSEKRYVYVRFLVAYDSINNVMLFANSMIGMLGNLFFLSLSFDHFHPHKRSQNSIIDSDYERRLRRLSEVPVSMAISQRKNRAILIGIGLCIGFTAISIIDSVFNGFRGPAQLLSAAKVTSHRGSSWEAPENTSEAVEKAIAEMADYTEIDVRLTKDKVPIILHDANVKRTTGVNAYIWDLTYEQVSKLDAGSWFSSDYTGVHIPKLEDILQLCKGKINLNIEIKNSVKSPETVEKTVDLIKAYHFENQCVITSSALRDLQEVKSLEQDLKTGYIIQAAYGNFYDRDESDFFSVKSTFVNERMMKSAHSRGKEIHAWTVNSRAELERMKSLGVDNIITDRPVFAKEILYQEEHNKTFTDLLSLFLY